MLPATLITVEMILRWMFNYLSLTGSGQNLWQTEGGELFRSKGGSQTGDSHQDGRCRCREGHWQGRQDGKQPDTLFSLPFRYLPCHSTLLPSARRLLRPPHVTTFCVSRWTSCRTWQQQRWWSPENRRLMKMTKSLSRSMDIFTPAR